MLAASDWVSSASATALRKHMAGMVVGKPPVETRCKRMAVWLNPTIVARLSIAHGPAMANCARRPIRNRVRRLTRTTSFARKNDAATFGGLRCLQAASLSCPQP
jgi:hypothetical protein